MSLAPAGGAPQAAITRAPSRPYGAPLMLGAVALGACVLAYLVLVVPGAWFPAAAPMSWSARDLRLAEGGATLANDEFVVAAAHPRTGIALITLATDFRARDYPAIAWTAVDVGDSTEVQMVWRTDYAPLKINTISVPVLAGRLMPVVAAGDPNWVGRITGLALSIRGPIAQPLRIRGVTAKPMGMADVLSDRAHEWLAFEGWSGTSINTVAGGADIQELPLPPLLVLALVLAAALSFAWARRHGNTAAWPAMLAVLFIAAWTMLDVRWTWNLARQVRETAAQYAGKDWHERRLAAEDGPLFAFIEKVRERLPAKPARVFMLADAHYFRGRGAYHLYPHNVYFDPYQNTTPPPSLVHAGDYIVVYQRRGVQYDASQRNLRWDGGAPIRAELLLAERGGALFRVL